MMDAVTGNILFVDDDKFLADMYGMKFTSAGYTVQSCLSVAEALSALKSGFKPDAVVFDLTMPERDGFSFLDDISKGNMAPDAALIALTNTSDPEEKTKAERLGVQRYIVKASMIPSEVVQAVGEEIAKRRK